MDNPTKMVKWSGEHGAPYENGSLFSLLIYTVTLEVWMRAGVHRA